jgi:hypothetical protein
MSDLWACLGMAACFAAGILYVHACNALRKEKVSHD